MKRGMDKWLQKKIDEDLIAMADEWEKELMESEELQGIEMPAEGLEEIYRRLEEERHASHRIRIHRRAWIAVAAVLVLCIGAGVVSNGSKVYVPEIFQSMRGDEVQTKVDNAEAVYSEYREEDVCLEIEEKLGVLPVRFAYRPSGMSLVKYWIKEDEDETLLTYKLEENSLNVYISKDYRNSTISNQSDGEILDTLLIESCGIMIEVYVVDDSLGGEYYAASFEYLNTYYSINGTMDQNEFIKILENIWIKNV